MRDQKTTTPGITTPVPKVRRSRDGSPGILVRPLAGKTIFLDIPGFRGAPAFEEDLKRLGGTMEKCFSKEVGWLITNNKAYLRELENIRNAATSPSNPSPANPSPFTMGGIRAVDSPQADSPSGGIAGSKPITRGMAIAQKAKNTKNYGSTNLVETAKQWKIKIVPLDQAQKYVKKELCKLPPSIRMESKVNDDDTKKKHKVRHLKGDFLKFESTTKQYKPIQNEFPAFPRINTETIKGSCPFENRTKPAQKQQGGGNMERAEQEDGGKEAGLQTVDLVAALTPPVENTAQSHNIPPPKPTKVKNKSKEGSKSYTSNKLYTAGELRKIMVEKAKAEQKRGYCELCNVKYDNIDTHVKLESHRKFVGNEKNFISLDLIIARGPNMEQFLNDVVKYHKEHVKEGLQMSELEDEVMIISQSTQSSVESNPAPKKDDVEDTATVPAESTALTSKKVQFKKLDTRKHMLLPRAKLLEPVESGSNITASKQEDTDVSKSGEVKPDLEVVVVKSTSESKKEESVVSKSGVEIRQLSPVKSLFKGKEDSILSTPSKKRRRIARKERGLSPTSTESSQNALRMQEVVTQKASLQKLSDIMSNVVSPHTPVLLTPKKPAVMVITPKSTRNTNTTTTSSSINTSARRSDIDGAKRLLNPMLNSVKELDNLHNKSTDEIVVLEERAKDTSECSEIIPVIGKILPVLSLTSIKESPSSLFPNAGTTPGSSVPFSPTVSSSKAVGYSRQISGISKLPTVEEKCQNDGAVKVTKIDLSRVECAQVSPKDSSLNDTLTVECVKATTSKNALGLEPIASGQNSSLVKTSDTAQDNPSLPSQEEIMQAVANAGLMVTACSTVGSSVSSYKPIIRQEPPKKTYSKVERSGEGSSSKTSKVGKSIQNEAHMVGQEHNYSSPVKEKEDERSKKRWEAAIGKAKKEEEEGMEMGSPDTQKGRQRVKVKHQWSILSDRSMKKMLQSEGDNVFEGFNETNQNLPTDVSYVDVSEVSISDNSEVEWNLDSYTKSPLKRSPRKSRKLGIATPLLIPEPHIDIIDETDNPNANWEGVKGAKNVLKSFFNPYLQDIQQEKLWLNSSPMKASPTKRQEETESLASIVEDKKPELSSPQISPVGKVTGPLHSTPMVKQVPAQGGYVLESPLRRSPRKKAKLEHVIQEDGVVKFNAASSDYKSPPNPSRRASSTPQHSHKALASSQGRTLPKQLPAEAVLSSKRSCSEISDASTAPSSRKRLLKSKSDVRKSFNFDYMTTSSKKQSQTSQREFDRLVSEYKKTANSSVNDKTVLYASQDATDPKTPVNSEERFSYDKPSDESGQGSTPNVTKGFTPNLRLSLTMLKVSKKGCLCHEHTSDSPCPLAHTPKKMSEQSERLPQVIEVDEDIQFNIKDDEEDSRSSRRRRSDKVRKRLDSIVLEKTGDENSDCLGKKRDSTMSKVARNTRKGTQTKAEKVKSKSPRKSLRNELPDQSKSPRRNLAKMMLETVGKPSNTRKGVKRKEKDTLESSTSKRTGIQQYDFSSGLDSFS